MADFGPSVGVQMTGLKAFTRDLRKANKALPKKLQAQMKQAGDVVADDARSRASWSSRIPGSIRTGASAKGAYIKAGGAAAPHAAAYETAGQFRHPVFGRDTWVEEQGRPFMVPALEARESDIEAAAVAALDAFIADAGFR